MADTKFNYTVQTACHPEDVKHYDIMIGKTTVEIHRFSDVNASAHYDKIYQK